MTTILPVYTVRLDEEIAHTMRQSSDHSCVEKRDVEVEHEVKTRRHTLTLIETEDSDEPN
jgi:hypothetical protein